MPNRLAGAASPYLLQHAGNPVDWHLWGEEAFARARREDRPVLLSIGYAACHWCHVMAHESFEDEATARLMNERFVCVKVDREERPDVDAVYMSAVQAMTGSGGWPLTVVVTPDGAPFFGGTYFPPDDRWGRPSFRRVLEAVSEAWRQRRSEVEEAARQVGARLQALEAPFGHDPGRATAFEASARQALAVLAAEFDGEHGGFGGAPKFPPHGSLRFLLSRPEEEALSMAGATLDAMADGGIHDPIGGGFARYSVDERWHLPHFEKMLYDNAQLLARYAEAYRRTGVRRYAVVAESIVAWLGREMRAPDGGLSSSLDADSAGEEGRFYTWTDDEVRAAAGADAALLARVFGVRTPGPFEGRNVLRRALPVEEAGRLEGLDPAAATARFERGRAALARAREGRPRPALDDKVLTSWNGLALWGLAEAAASIGNGEALALAEEVVAFLRERAWSDGRLHHVVRGEVAHVEGLLEDYAYLALGLLALHRLTLEPALLAWGLELADVIRRDFEAPEGGFYSTSARATRLLVRPRSLSDAAVPSDNAAAAELLVRLARLSGDDTLAAAAARAVAPLREPMERYPQAFAATLIVCAELERAPREVVLVGDPHADDTAALQRVWQRRLDPSVAALLVGGPEDPLVARLPLAQGRARLAGRATAYVCEAGACRLPVTDAAAFERELDALAIGAGGPAGPARRRPGA